MICQYARRASESTSSFACPYHHALTWIGNVWCERRSLRHWRRYTWRFLKLSTSAASEWFVLVSQDAQSDVRLRSSTSSSDWADRRRRELYRDRRVEGEG